MTEQAVTRLYPAPLTPVSLTGLYLRQDLRRHRRGPEPFVYTNFITSLDGRVAVRGVGQSAKKIPPALANARDWRLYQELAAQADVVVVSAGHARAMAKDPNLYPFPFAEPTDTCDLKQWRLERGLSESPSLAIVTATIELPVETLSEVVPAPLLCLCGHDLLALAQTRLGTFPDVQIFSAGDGAQVTGQGLRASLRDDYPIIYSVAGAGLMRPLLNDRALDRLYLTQVDRLIGGIAFDTLVEAPGFTPPIDLSLEALYQDSAASLSASQSYAVYDVH